MQTMSLLARHTPYSGAQAINGVFKVCGFASRSESAKLASGFARAVTISCDESEACIARKGNASLFATFHKIYPQISEKQKGRRRSMCSMSESAFNKALQSKCGFLVCRTRRKNLGSNRRWLNPRDPEDSQTLKTNFDQLCTDFPSFTKCTWDDFTSVLTDVHDAWELQCSKKCRRGRNPASRKSDCASDSANSDVQPFQSNFLASQTISQVNLSFLHPYRDCNTLAAAIGKITANHTRAQASLASFELAKGDIPFPVSDIVQQGSERFHNPPSAQLGSWPSADLDFKEQPLFRPSMPAYHGGEDAAGLLEISFFENENIAVESMVTDHRFSKSTHLNAGQSVERALDAHWSMVSSGSSFVENMEFQHFAEVFARSRSL